MGLDLAGQPAYVVQVPGLTRQQPGLGWLDDHQPQALGAEPDDYRGSGHRLADRGSGACDNDDGSELAHPPVTSLRTFAAWAVSSVVWCACAVIRSREMPSGVEGGRKHPIRMPRSAQTATASRASRGPGIGTESTAPAGGWTLQLSARMAAVARARSTSPGAAGVAAAAG